MFEFVPGPRTDWPASPTSGCGGSSTKTTSRKYSVAIVEDDACLRRLLRLYLGKSFEGTDWEAGDAFLASLGQEPPDLVVMDLNLRGLSGIEVIQAIRKRFPDRKRPGILLVSGIFSRCSEPELAATGADDSLGKPFTHREFLDRIYKLLDRDIN